LSGLNLVRIRVDLRALAAFAIAERVDDDDRGYATHLALRSRFGTAAPQPFRLFETGAGAPYLLGYTVDAPALADAAELPPMDERLAAVFPETPSCRTMPDQWRLGARYAFEVRVRPIVRYGTRARAARRAEGRVDARERDAFLAAVEKEGETGIVDRETVYQAWLLHQMSSTACVEAAAITHMRRLTTYRSAHKRPGRERIDGYDVLFAGTLAVQDPAAFTQLLARGVGRHAAFGFGMLALAPPRRG
jgi:CRISPR system Cascade subunit CasE